VSGPQELPSRGVPIRAWTEGVPVEDVALQQLQNVALLPVVHHHVAVMPDVHWGMGATVGSVIPTLGAIIPAAVGVDIGCGMCAQRTTLTANDLPDDLGPMRKAIEAAVPHGRTRHGGRGDKGAWREPPRRVRNLWREHLSEDFDALCGKYRNLERANHLHHLGSLGTGNHFIEVCLDEDERVWLMLHSGSRGIGNRIAQVFIERARKEMRVHLRNLPDKDLAWLKEGTQSFDDYVRAVDWAQRFARINRQAMMELVVGAVAKVRGVRRFEADARVVNCHHNYVQREEHFGAQVWLTRKGAVRAGRGELGIIPGSMGSRSYVVEGRGNPQSFLSCSHGAGRAMSRNEARRRYSVEEHIEATRHVECRKDVEVLDETPMAYKQIDAVMAAQRDLVDVVHTLRQVVCVKG
jgi:tRNA-splicing ligase RtcB